MFATPFKLVFGFGLSGFGKPPVPGQSTGSNPNIADLHNCSLYSWTTYTKRVLFGGVFRTGTINSHLVRINVVRSQF